MLAVGRAASKHSWRTVLPFVLRMSGVLHVVEGKWGGSSGLVADGDGEGLRCGARSQEESALRAQHGILLVLPLALAACGRLPRSDAK